MVEIATRSCLKQHPNQMVAGLGWFFLLLAGLWRFIAWIREAPSKPIVGCRGEQKLSDRKPWRFASLFDSTATTACCLQTLREGRWSLQQPDALSQMCSPKARC